MIKNVTKMQTYEFYPMNKRCTITVRNSKDGSMVEELELIQHADMHTIKFTGSGITNLMEILTEIVPPLPSAKASEESRPIDADKLLLARAYSVLIAQDNGAHKYKFLLEDIKASVGDIYGMPLDGVAPKTMEAEYSAFISEMYRKLDNLLGSNHLDNSVRNYICGMIEDVKALRADTRKASEADKDPSGMSDLLRGENPCREMENNLRSTKPAVCDIVSGRVVEPDKAPSGMSALLYGENPCRVLADSLSKEYATTIANESMRVRNLRRENEDLQRRLRGEK